MIKTEEEINLIREASYIVSETHKYMKDFIKPGITTRELDKLAEDFIISKGANASCKGYEGFPAAICISINDEVVHGIASDRRLKDGDIVTLDIVADKNGYHGDSGWTYPVGKISKEDEYLLEHTEKALLEGLKVLKPGIRIGDLACAIQTYAESKKLSVVRELTGHGIGRSMHELPDVPNYGHKNTGLVIKEGMVLAVEPMLNYGRKDIGVLEDDWTIVTLDGKNSAHFEHTVVVTKDGCEILTKRI